MDSQSGEAETRVLVVEDDQSVRRMLRYSLRDSGFAITEVTNGEEALRVLNNHPPEAVILDLGLPDGQGGAALDQIRQMEEETHGLPVWVVISSLDREEATRRYGFLGNRFVPKPFNPWDLIKKLEDLLSSSSEV